MDIWKRTQDHRHLRHARRGRGHPARRPRDHDDQRSARAHRQGHAGRSAAAAHAQDAARASALLRLSRRAIELSGRVRARRGQSCRLTTSIRESSMTIMEHASGFAAIGDALLAHRRGARGRPRSDQGRVRRNQAHLRLAPAHGGRRPGSARPRTRSALTLRAAARLRNRQGVEHRAARRRRGGHAARGRLSPGSGGAGDGRRIRWLPIEEAYEINRFQLTNTSLPGTTLTLGPPAHPARRPAFHRQLGLAAERADVRRVAHGESQRHEPGARRHVPEPRQSRHRSGIAARRLQGRRLPAECRVPDEDRQAQRVRLSTRLRADHQHSGRHEPGARLDVDVWPALRRRQAGGQDQARLTPRPTRRKPTTRDNPLDLRSRLHVRRAHGDVPPVRPGRGHGNHGRQRLPGDKGFTTPLAHAAQVPGLGRQVPDDARRTASKTCTRTASVNLKGVGVLDTLAASS